MTIPTRAATGAPLLTILLCHDKDTTEDSPGSETRKLDNIKTEEEALSRDRGGDANFADRLPEKLCGCWFHCIMWF